MGDKLKLRCKLGIHKWAYVVKRCQDCGYRRG